MNGLLALATQVIVVGSARLPETWTVTLGIPESLPVDLKTIRHPHRFVSRKGDKLTLLVTPTRLGNMSFVITEDLMPDGHPVNFTYVPSDRKARTVFGALGFIRTQAKELFFGGSEHLFPLGEWDIVNRMRAYNAQGNRDRLKGLPPARIWFRKGAPAVDPRLERVVIREEAIGNGDEILVSILTDGFKARWKEVSIKDSDPRTLAVTSLARSGVLPVPTALKMWSESLSSGSPSAIRTLTATLDLYWRSGGRGDLSQLIEAEPRSLEMEMRPWVGESGAKEVLHLLQDATSDDLSVALSRFGYRLDLAPSRTPDLGFKTRVEGDRLVVAERTDDSPLLIGDVIQSVEGERIGTTMPDIKKNQACRFDVLRNGVLVTLIFTPRVSEAATEYVIVADPDASESATSLAKSFWAGSR